jgi:hypothetical protein
MRRLLLVLLASALVAAAAPAAAGATSLSIGQPEGATPPAGGTPGFQAEVVRGHVTPPAEDCSYGIQAQYTTTTGADATQPSATNHRSAAFGTSPGRTSRRRR